MFALVALALLVAGAAIGCEAWVSYRIYRRLRLRHFQLVALMGVLALAFLLSALVFWGSSADQSGAVPAATGITVLVVFVLCLMGLGTAAAYYVLFVEHPGVTAVYRSMRVMDWVLGRPPALGSVPQRGAVSRREGVTVGVFLLALLALHMRTNSFVWVSLHTQRSFQVLYATGVCCCLFLTICAVLRGRR
jgi:hypothetical protein